MTRYSNSKSQTVIDCWEWIPIGSFLEQLYFLNDWRQQKSVLLDFGRGRGWTLLNGLKNLYKSHRNDKRPGENRKEAGELLRRAFTQMKWALMQEIKTLGLVRLIFSIHIRAWLEDYQTQTIKVGLVSGNMKQATAITVAVFSTRLQYVPYKWKPGSQPNRYSN